MKKIVLPIFSILVLCLTGSGQQLPSGANQPLEKQVLQISAPLKNNLFTTIKEPLTKNSRFTFDSLSMTYQSSWGFGQSFSVSSDTSGNLIFVGSGSGVIILDVTTPQNPVTVAEISARGLVDAIYYDEATKRLYLTAYFAGFEIWDLNQLTAPVRIGGGPTTGLPRGGIFASGNIVYVVTVADGVQVFDITDPANPVITGTCIIDPDNLCWNSAKNGNLIYAATGEGGLVVIDVTDPLDPHIAGNYAGLTSGVSIANGHAYTVSWDNTFHVLDISNVTNITETGSCFLNGYPVRTEVKGNYVYVANSTTNAGGGINVVNVTNPAAPAVVTTYAGYADHVTVNGNVVSFTGSSLPCTILTITDPAAPEFASDYQIPVFTSDVHVDGNYLYTGNNGFRVFDISNPASPVQVGYDTSDRAGAIVRTAGDLAVFIRESMGANNPIMIMDITDPAHPALLGQYLTPVMTSDLEIKDHYAFVGCWWDGFRVIDFQNASNPIQVAHGAGWFNGAIPGVDFCYVQALD
ncbi:MAG: LVIVD repeat-containing protein, partial [Syntrophothermus sp.]